MSYVSLYRKYRSQTFDEVMGQEHVTRTLQNAIRQGKIGHAYLFCGTRGTGKTTTARLLAKALNCEKGPTPEPCNICQPCKSITEGSAIDIVEMDAASHRGIDDVKEIRDNVKFPPMALRYKVFIIDEAHQLSNDAKDAFLKTLEEPPPYVVFILATTEPHKIPITIRSRCQQFDFRRGSLDAIRSRLEFVAKQEGIQVDDGALDLIALNAEGSWRDGLSIMEQVLAYTDGSITTEDVYKVLGTVTQDFLFRTADAIATRDESGVFQIAAEAAGSGKDLRQLLRSLAEHFRNLVFATVTRDQKVLATGKETAERLIQQSAKFNKDALIRIVEILSEAEREARLSDQHRLITEMALLKCIQAVRQGIQTPLDVTSSADTTPPKRVTVQEKAAQTAEPSPSQSPITEPSETPVPPSAGIKQELPEFATISQKWNQVLQHVKNISISAHALLSTSTPAEIRNGMLVIQLKHKAHCDLINSEVDKPGSQSKRRALQIALQKVFGVPNVKIICEAKEAEQNKSVEVLVPPPEEDDDLPSPWEDPGDAVQANDPLRNVLEVFPNAELLDD